MATKEEREAWLRRVHVRLAAAIHRDVPEGIGMWEDAWEAVDEPSRRFDEAARAYLEGEPGIEKEYVVDLGRLVLVAWQQQAALYSDQAQRRNDGSTR